MDIKPELNEEVVKMEADWSNRMKLIRKNVGSVEARSASIHPQAWMESQPFSAQSLGVLLDSRFEEIKKEVRALSDQSLRDQSEREESRRHSGRLEQLEIRLSALEKQLASFTEALSEVQKIESFIKDARQKQYETFVEDRGKLRVDYLDLKQEVTQKLKIMQLRIEDLIAASAAQSFRSVEPSADAANDVSHLSSLPDADEKGFFRKLADWWNEPVLSFSGSKEREKEGPAFDPTDNP